MRTTVRVGNVEVTAIRDKAHSFDRAWALPERSRGGLGTVPGPHGERSWQRHGQFPLLRGSRGRTGRADRYRLGTRAGTSGGAEVARGVAGSAGGDRFGRGGHRSGGLHPPARRPRGLESGVRRRCHLAPLRERPLSGLRAGLGLLQLPRREPPEHRPPSPAAGAHRSTGHLPGWPPADPVDHGGRHTGPHPGPHQLRGPVRPRAAVHPRRPHPPSGRGNRDRVGTPVRRRP